MDILILSIFAIVVVLSLMEDHMPAWQKLILLFSIAIALICISTFKPMTTADAANYEKFFYFHDNILIETMTEPTYIYLSRLYLSLGFGVIAMFLTYALIAIPIKLTLLWKLTPFVFTAMIVYVGIYYPMQDVVQIRCGVATAFLFWTIIPLEKRQYFKAAALLIVAALFHYSSLAFLPILFVGNMEIGKYWKWILGLSIPICILLYIAGFGAFSLIPGEAIEGKLDHYREVSETGADVKYVPYKQIAFMAEFIMLYIFIFFYDTIHRHCRYAPILIKVLALEMGFLILFADIEVLGKRLHDLFGIFNTLSFTCLLYIIRPRYVARIGLAAFCLTHYIVHMINEIYFH
ncbi:MAG: EpsG family protein [Prevotella sp.]|nr:EpsG family protein [Prevotella sp.]MBQ8455756.1 EpsG family protein [Bacteroidaceae bacterium]MBQ9293908.1 EpsG family protein [Bacteroidaceae bacterium]